MERIDPASSRGARREGEDAGPRFPTMRTHTVALPGQTMGALSANESAGGPPVVFLHGITASAELWLPSMPAEICAGRRWISLGLPGHHPARMERSRVESQDAFAVQWAEWHEAALRELIGDEPADFVGWSVGGFTALALATHYPRRVRSLLSIAGFATGRWHGFLGLMQRASLNPLTRGAARHGITAVGRRRWLFDRAMELGVGDRESFRASPAGIPTMNAWFAAFGGHDPAVLVELFRRFSRVDLSDGLARIACPALIAGGEIDAYIPAHHTRWIAKQVPGAQLTLWPGAGHLFFAERTHAYQEMLVRWLHR